MDAFRFILDIGMIQGLILLAGLVFVIIEMFHPGFGVPGILGVVLLLVGIIMVSETIVDALILIAILLTILAIALKIVLHSVAKGRLSKTLILSHSQNKEGGYIGVEDMKYFLGKEGIAVSILRPSGTVEFDGVRLDVVSEGNFIQEGTKVKVVKVDGRKIVVREI